MFGVNKEDAVEFTGSKYIKPGIQELKINDLEIELAKTGTPRIKFIVETRPVTDKGFVPDETATAGGKVGTIRSSYLKNDDQKVEFSKNMVFIARHLGEKEETTLDGLFADTLEEYIEKIKPILTGKFVHFKVCGEEYQKDDGKIGMTMRFARFGFVNADETKLKFDENNQYDIKRLEIPDEDVPTDTTDSGSELKF